MSENPFGYVLALCVVTFWGGFGLTLGIRAALAFADWLSRKGGGR